MQAKAKIYTSDTYWRHIFADLGVALAESPNESDVNFDEIDVKTPISVLDLKNIVLNRFENSDIIREILGKNTVLPVLSRRILVLLYKNNGLTMRELKELLGISPEITSHTVENAIYQLRKTFGHDLIQNIGGKYKIGRV